jgi:hypothetical protein
VSCFASFIFDFTLQYAIKKVLAKEEGLILNWKYQVPIYANNFNLFAEQCKLRRKTQKLYKFIVWSLSEK